jgi:1-acyl-sn-glycerol-3-phosphate acyltransferase
MTADQAAITVLCLYAAVAVASPFWQAFRCPAGPMLWWLYVAERLFCGLLWHVRGVAPDGRQKRCPFPQNSAALIVANHRSPVDPIVLWQNSHLAGQRPLLRPISFLMAREYYEDRRLTWFYRAMRSIPVTRGGNDAAAVRQSIQHLKAGDLVGIFPEGGINTGPPGLRPANPGVAFLALSTDAPVYPVYIAGSPVSRSMVRAFFSPARTHLIYGDPLDLSPYRGKRKTQEMLREVTDLIMNTVAALGGVTYAGTLAAEETEPPRPAKTAEPGSPPATSSNGGQQSCDCQGTAPTATQTAPSPVEA